MSAEHKRPMIAFVVVAIICAVLVVNATRSSAAYLLLQHGQRPTVVAANVLELATLPRAEATVSDPPGAGSPAAPGTLAPQERPQRDGARQGSGDHQRGDKNPVSYSKSHQVGSGRDAGAMPQGPQPSDDAASLAGAGGGPGSGGRDDGPLSDGDQHQGAVAGSAPDGHTSAESESAEQPTQPESGDDQAEGEPAEDGDRAEGDTATRDESRRGERHPHRGRHHRHHGDHHGGRQADDADDSERGKRGSIIERDWRDLGARFQGFGHWS